MCGNEINIKLLNIKLNSIKYACERLFNNLFIHKLSISIVFSMTESAPCPSHGSGCVMHINKIIH